MTTGVGVQYDLVDAIKDLIELDYDATESYEVAIDRLENKDYKNKLTEFKEDHLRHIQELSNLLVLRQEKAPTGPDNTKQWLTKGKVVIGGIVGDRGVLAAMKSNEIDTNTAYERMNDRNDLWEDARDIIKRGLQDERKHKAWLETILEVDF